MGKTIIISSHILKELAELCNVVGIIERGELIFSGSVRDAMQRVKVGKSLSVRVADRSSEAAALLARTPGVAKVAVVDTDHGPQVNVTLDDAVAVDPSDFPSRLINAGFRVQHFAEEQVDLETVFMRLTKGLVQ